MEENKTNKPHDENRGTDQNDGSPRGCKKQFNKTFHGIA
jgi:hypothetical protein